EESRPRPTPRSFLATYRALRADFGSIGLAVATLASVGIVGWAIVDLMAAHTGYLRAALFHGHLELAVAALTLVEGRRLVDYDSPPLDKRAGVLAARQPSC